MTRLCPETLLVHMQANPRLRRTVQFFGTIHLGAEPVIIGGARRMSCAPHVAESLRNVGFYSYGDTRWSQIYEWTSEFWTPVQKADRNLRFFDYNVDTEVIGEVHPPSPTLVGNGTYIIRYVDASDVVLAVSPYRGRTRVPTLSNTEPRVRGCFSFFSPLDVPSIEWRLSHAHSRPRRSHMPHHRPFTI